MVAKTEAPSRATTDQKPTGVGLVVLCREEDEGGEVIVEGRPELLMLRIDRKNLSLVTQIISILNSQEE